MGRWMKVRATAQPKPSEGNHEKKYRLTADNVWSTLSRSENGIFDATDFSCDEIYVRPEYRERRPQTVGGRRWTINILRTFAPNCK